MTPKPKKRASKRTEDTTMKHIGNLEIRTAADAKKYAGLTEVTGDLYINSSAKLDALTSVGGHLYIYSSAKLDALTSVGGHLYIYSSAKLTAGKLYTGDYSKFSVLDGIPCVTLSSKCRDGITVLSCRRAKIKNHKVVGDKFYVAQSGEHNAHAATIAEAVRELQFKTGCRDIEQFRDMPRNIKKTPEEWAFVYRMVTGACQFGTKDFMERKGKLKKSYTLAEILDETRGAWGYEQFVSVVGASP